MLRCEVKFKRQYDCIQWTGNNLDEFKEIFGGQVSKSPFEGGQIALKGGDSYFTVEMNEWILRDDEGEIYLVEPTMFEADYQITESA